MQLVVNDPLLRPMFAPHLEYFQVPPPPRRGKENSCSEEPLVVYNKFSRFAYQAKKQSYIFLCAIYPDIMSKIITYVYRDPIPLPISVCLKQRQNHFR